LGGVYVTIAGFQGSEARFDANVSRGLVDTKPQTRNSDRGIGKWQSVLEGEFGVRHGGVLIVLFCFSTAFVGRLILSGQRLVVGGDVPVEGRVSESLADDKCSRSYFSGWEFILVSIRGSY